MFLLNIKTHLHKLFYSLHCDPTINLFDKYYLVRGDIVEGAWDIDLRGCSQ